MTLRPTRISCPRFAAVLAGCALAAAGRGTATDRVPAEGHQAAGGRDGRAAFGAS